MSDLPAHALVRVYAEAEIRHAVTEPVTYVYYAFAA
jgi:hypothetical protein